MPTVPANLTSLLENCHLPIEIDESVSQTVAALTAPGEDDVALPAGLTLRPYQQRGYHWLKTLDRLHMGGILADDMGLGKNGAGDCADAGCTPGEGSRGVPGGGAHLPGV